MRNSVTNFHFFFNDTATTEIYTLSLHDALPIWLDGWQRPTRARSRPRAERPMRRVTTWPVKNGVSPRAAQTARKAQTASTENGRAHVLNSSHANNSYAVFCL